MLPRPTEADGTAAGDAATETFTTDFTNPVTLSGNDAIQFDLSVNGGDAKTVTINAQTINTALGSSAAGSISSAADFAKVMSTALTNAGFSVGTTGDVTVDATTGTISSVATSDGTTPVKMAITNVDSSNNGNFTNVMDIDITNATSAQLTSYLANVDTMFQNVTTAASNLGAVQSRITSQQTFVSDLMNSIDSGVGSLVDADMNEASTRLKALQTQQQLGIQALSIANSNSSNILSLFR